MDMEISEVFFWPQTERGEVRALVKFITTVSWTPHTSSNLLNYYITLADLSVGRFACYVIQRNDLRQLL